MKSQGIMTGRVKRITSRMILPLLMAVVVATLPACRTTSAVSKESDHRSDSPDTCGPEGMAARRAATFERSKSCAADAIGIGLAESIQAAANAAGEAKALATAIKSFNQFQKTAAFNVNIAKGTLCAQTLFGGYGLTETVKLTTDRLVSAGLSPDQEYQSLATIAANAATGGLPEAFHLLGEFIEDPTLEHAIKFGAKSLNSYAEISRVITTCGNVFNNVLAQNKLNVIQLAKLNKIFVKVTVAAGIANCASAGLFNAVDAGTEINCLIQDLNYLHEQTARILVAEQNLCEDLGEIASLPTSRPALASIRNTLDPETGGLDEVSNTRAALCQRVISNWGRCLASTTLSLRSEGYCRKLCTRMSNSTREDFMRAAVATRFEDPGKIAGLVGDASDYCLSAGNPPGLVHDGNTPCVNLCMQGDGGELQEAYPQQLPP